MRAPVLRFVLVPLVAAALMLGCAGTGRSSAPPAQPGAESVSSVEPAHGEFATRPEPVAQLPPVASSGGCEPRYRNGRTGTCIYDQPCRGFGVLERDRAECRCFATRGGCAEGYRCDTRAAECIREDEDEFNRLR